MYDLAIIGAGWAGFNAALRAKTLGLKAALIEESLLGGTCLNRGCIPTKTLVQSSTILEETGKAASFGVKIDGSPAIDLAAVIGRKERIVAGLRQGMESRLAGIDYLTGHAEFWGEHTVKVDGRSVEASNILIATGSEPFGLTGFAFDGNKIVSSDHILQLDKIPQTLLIIGGGVMGCEFCRIFSSFGTKVTLVELTEQLLPGVDREIARKLETIFKKKRITVLTGTNASTLNPEDFEKILVSVGRKARVSGLEKTGIKVNRSGIEIDEYLRTNIPGIYAAGDCTGKLMLAHFAGYQGRIAAENIKETEKPRKADNPVVPSCIFTRPEIASVGMNEAQAQEKGMKVKVNRFDFLGSGMARIQDEAEGFLKIVSDSGSGKLIGCQMIGPKVTELISVFGVSLSSNLGVKDLKNTIFSHPSLSEAIFEALD